MKLTLEEMKEKNAITTWEELDSFTGTGRALRTWKKLKKANKNAGMERSRKMTAARYGVKLDEKVKK